MVRTGYHIKRIMTIIIGGILSAYESTLDCVDKFDEG